ncbi:MAG: protoporphyrinogen oxidase [Bacteroidetes bacterium]|nr:protoporphyrinogen oxidase [Bacteroidota bacterium]
MKRTVIIGGGISGLSASWTLCQAPDSGEVLLLEQRDRLGGSIYTEHDHGFMIEHGPDGFLANKPEAVELCKSLGLSLQRPNDSQHGVYLRRGHKMYLLPGGLLPQRQWPYIRSPLLSSLGKLRLFLELVVPPKQDASDESVAHFFIRRFGREAFTNLIKPLLGGFAGDDVEHLSMQAILPHLRHLESNYGSLILGAHRIGADKHQAEFRTLPNGLSSLIDALYESSKDRIRLGYTVTHIKRSDTHWNVHIDGQSPISASHIIFAVPAWVAAKIIHSVNAELAALLFEIPYRSGTMIHLAYHKKDVKQSLRGHGHLIASEEAISACTWSTNKYTGRSSAETQLFRLYLRGTDLPDRDVIMKARSELEKALNITSTPMLTRIYHHQDALPQYQLGHQEHIEKIQNMIESMDGLYLTGNYLVGVGIPDCIRLSTLVANRVLER